MIKRRAIEPSQLARKRRKRRLVKFYFWLILLLIIIATSAFASHLSTLSITSVVVMGNQAESTEDFLNIVKANTTGNYYWMFSKNNILLFPESQIKNDVMAAHKRIMNISISRTSLQGIKLSVTERKPIGIFKNGNDTSDQNLFLIDEQGYIFAHAPALSGNIFFTYYGLINSTDPIGENYLSPDEFSRLNSFVEDVKKLGADPLALRADNSRDFELDLSGGGKILFTTDEPLDKILNNLQVLTNNNSSGSSIDLAQIEYLNLRNGNKIVYKLKQ